MLRLKSRTCTWLALGAMLIVPALNAQVVTRQAAAQALERNDVAQRRDRLRTLGAQGDLPALLREAQALAADQGIDADALLDAALHELSRLRPTDAAYAWVESISRRAPQFFVRIDPDHSEAVTPLFDPGATARYVLDAWRRAAARDAALASLAVSSSASFEQLASGSAAERAGLLDALRSAPPAQLALQRQWLIQRTAVQPELAEAAMIVAERLDDRELLEQALMTAPQTAALQALSELSQRFDQATTRQVLIKLSTRPELASAALLELGALASEDSASRAYLFSRIGDPMQGDSAAAALAAAHDSAVIDEMGRRLLTSRQDAARRQLALALKLEGSSASRAHLQSFLQKGAGSTKLRKEVKSWLAQ